LAPALRTGATQPGDMARLKLVIDTDPGVDDALAIFMAFNSPEARCTHGGRALSAARAAHARGVTLRVCAAALERVTDRRRSAAWLPRAAQVEVLGLTTIFGNVTTTMATANALHLCEMAGRADVQVAQARARVVAAGCCAELARGVRRTRSRVTRRTAARRARWDRCRAA
jgi:hypothetical protein